MTYYMHIMSERPANFLHRHGYIAYAAAFEGVPGVVRGLAKSLRQIRREQRVHIKKRRLLRGEETYDGDDLEYIRVYL